MEEVLGPEALNRATLARQHLLERVEMPGAAMVEHLVGMQAQAPLAPYVGLWNRITGFDPQPVASQMLDRSLVRVACMRTTIHTVTVADARRLRPLIQPKLERTFMSTAWGQHLRNAEAPIDAIVEAGRQHFEAQPRGRAEVAGLLAEQFPRLDPEAMAYLASYFLPLVQITPRGVWGQQGNQATWTTLHAWTGQDVEADPPVDEMVLRYLAAFGPATVMDVQTWCGLTKLKPVLERLRPQLVTFRDEAGKELFDLPEAPRPPAGTPAPVRFLPEYDNVLLGHKDRSRFQGEDPPDYGDGPRWAGNGSREGSLLVDGRFAGFWITEQDGDRSTVVAEPYINLTKATRADLQTEGERLAAFTGASDWQLRPRSSES